MSLLPPTPNRKPSSKSPTPEAPAKPQLCVVPLEDRVVPAGQVVGTVFLDFNANGLLDAAGTVANVGSGTTPTAADAGVGGVVVTAYDAANVAQGAATSAANGSYTLALANTGPYRLEFTNLPAGLSYGPRAGGASGSGTGVQFVPDNPPANAVNLSLVRPSAVTANNPTLVNNVYYFGTTAGATLVSYPYTSGASATETNSGVYTQPTAQTTVATNAQVGATWGLAYDAVSNRTFAAAFTKRHTSFGPNGPGGIYAVDATGATTPTLFVDLGAAAAGADFRAGGGYNYLTDTAGFDAVGKTGLGGLDVDDTGTFMYTVGLADRRLYRIALNPDGSAGTVTSFALPVPATASSGGVDVRPFAVEFHNGKVYVGAVDSAETSQQASDLKAYVFAFDPAVAGGSFVDLAGAATTTAAVLTSPLDYARGYVHPGDSNNPIPGEWNPWTAVRQTLANPGENYGIYPQPELTGLAFDDAGNVTLGLRDRAGDQFGFLANIDFSGRGLTVGISAGDVLKAFVNTPGDLGSGWTLESNGNGTGGAGNGQGPNGGEFYFQDELPGPGIGPGDDHQEVMVGGLLQLPGRDQVLVTAFDPVRIAQVYNAGGVRWFDTTDGTLSKAYQVFATGGTESTFAKAAGIGDLVAVSQLGREIGNRVWNDANGNGRQDPGEAGIVGVTVVLCQTDAGGTVVGALATATTDANGDYYFSSYTGSNTGSARYGLTQLNTPAPAGGSYQICIPQAQGALAGLQLTTFRAAGTNTQNDSDGISQGVNYVIQNVGTQALGTADHSHDIGFNNAPAQLSGFVYEDVNNSNTRNGGDTPLPGVTVVLTGTLTAGGTATPLTTTTDGTGFYSFTNLQAGSYTVTETQPAGFLNRGEQPGTTGGTAPQNGTVINSVPLANGQNSQNNNFGEVRLVQLSGFVYHDVSNDGTFNAGDAPLGGVTVVLTGTNDLGATITPLTQTTDGTGAYSFNALRPGTYTVTETQPAGFSDRTNNPGTVTNGTPGSVNGDVIQTIVLNSGATSPANNFGETSQVPPVAQLSGYVYRDPNLNGVREPGNGNETGLAGVGITLFREDAPGVLTKVGQTTTDATGFYSFVNLTPGLYRVAEAQPANFLSTQNAAGTTGGTAATNDTIFSIPLAGGQNSQANNFGEVPCTRLFGYVWVDANQNGVFDPGETPVAGTQVTLNGTAYAGSTAATPITAPLAGGSLTVTTDSNGRWSYTCLPPGTYSVNQTNTPAGFTNFQSQNNSGLPVQGSSATNFNGVNAQTSATGPLNFGIVPSTPQAVGASKQNFLGSSVPVSGTSGGTDALVDPAIGSLNTTPPFNVSTGDPSTPAYVVAAAGAGFAPVVRVFDYASKAEVLRIQAFEDGMTAGVRVATGDINGDGVPDVIAAAGPGAGPRVRVFDGVTGAAIRDFYAYPPQFRGGLYVAVGDFNGDGRMDIVTGAGEGGGPNVRVFDGATGTLLTSFFAFDSNQTGGARIAVGDFNGDGTPDIAASNGPGNTSLIRTFSGRGFGQMGQFTPYSSSYTGGVFLAAGDVNGDGVVDLVTGGDQGGGPNVRVFNAGTGQLQSSFFAFESSFTGGVRVAVRDITGDGNADIITGAGINGASRLRVFSGATLLPVEDFYMFNSAVRNGLYLG